MAPFTSGDAARVAESIRRYSRIQPDGSDAMILSMGPQHPATHGVLRVVMRLDGETITDVDLDVGYHHRGSEKIAERQTYHRYIPYTDRLDYLSGVSNNLPYVMAVEKLLGLDVPPRAQAIRVLLCELFRIVNHQVWVGTFAQDCGAITPAVYAFEHREQILDFVAKVTGGRMHPSWFRIGGVTQDLPEGWREDVEAWLGRFPSQLKEIEKLLTGNAIFVGRGRDTGGIGLDAAIDAGFTGPNLRACGLKWDLRKVTPYSGYQHYEFEIPTATEGDNYARYVVRIEEMRQSHRIIEQCVSSMPEGEYVAPDYRYSIPEPNRMLHDIESLIHHFVNVSRGFVPPPGEVYVATEAPKGEMGFYVVSNGSTLPYRVFIRTPSYPHMQAFPELVRGQMVSDVVATLGAIDFVLGDVDK